MILPLGAVSLLPRRAARGIGLQVVVQVQRSLSRVLRPSGKASSLGLVALAVLLVGCSTSSPAGGTDRPAAQQSSGAAAPTASPAADAEVPPSGGAEGAAGEATQQGRAGAGRPDWLPAHLPWPDGARVASVATDGTCEVVWLLSGADLQATAAELASAAERAGVSVRVKSSSRPTVPDPALVDDVLADLRGAEATPRPASIPLVGMRFSGPGASDPVVDLGLSGIAGGVVMGDYELPASVCTP